MAVAVLVITGLVLVPTIDTEKMPAADEVQVRVAVPEAVKLVVVKDPQLSPDGTVSVSVTVPGKPFTPVTVMVDVAEVPAGTAAGEVAVSVKLATVLTVWISAALVLPLKLPSPPYCAVIE